MNSMRKYGRYWLLSVFLVLSAADLYLTWQLFETEGESARETNPLANWILSEFGWDGLACFKFASAVLVVLLTTAVSYVRPRTGVRLLTGSSAILGAVVIYSTVLLLCPGVVSAESVALEQVIQERGREIDDALGRSRQRLANKADLTMKISQRQLTLAEAVECVLTAEEEGSPRLQMMRGIHPDLSQEQCVAMNLMEYMLIQVRTDAPKLKQLKQELAKVYESTYGTPVPASWWKTDDRVLSPAEWDSSPRTRVQWSMHHGSGRRPWHRWSRGG